MQLLDPNAKPLSGCFLFTFAAGTTTPQNTFTTAGGTIANPNPIRCDSGGYVNMWLGNGLSYKLVLEDQFGVMQYVQDNVTGPGLADGSSIDLTKVKYNPNWTGTSSITLQQWLNSQSINMLNFAGFATTNSDNGPQFNAAIAIAGIGNIPTVITVPPGVYLTCSSVLIQNSSVVMEGAGYGSDTGFPSLGTTIKACPAFNSSNTGTNFGKNYVTALNGTADMFGSRFENMTIDGAGVADTMYAGHANAQSGYDHITAQNFIHAGGGLYICGAGSGGSASTVCGANGSGASNDGPYSDLRFLPATSAVPIRIVNAVSLKDFSRINIVASGAAPASAGYVSGTHVGMRDIHIEGTLTGFQVGGDTSHGCPDSSICNGMNELSAENVDMTVSTGTSRAYELYTCVDCHLETISDTASSGKAIQTSFGSTVVSTDQNVGWLTTRYNGSTYQVWSSDPSWDWEFANTNLILDHNLQVNGNASVTGTLNSGAATLSSLSVTNGAAVGTTLSAGTSVTSPIGALTTVNSTTTNATTFNGHLNLISYGHSSSTTCPTAATDGATCSFTVNWQNTFPDALYSAACSIVTPTGAPHIDGITTQNTIGVIVQIRNGSSAQAIASGGTRLDCVAIEN